MQLESNYQKAASFIKSAAQQGAHLAVLPEYHLLGWVPEDPKFKESCGKWQIYLKRYQALAKEHNINIVPGTIVELHDQNTPNERLLNVAYFIDTTGAISGEYVKKNLWGPIERQHLTSSTTGLHPAFDTPLGKVGMLVCWDLAFPEAFRELIMQGAKLIIIPTFWLLTDCSKEGLDINPTAESLFLDSMLTARCFENTCGKTMNFLRTLALMSYRRLIVREQRLYSRTPVVHLVKGTLASLKSAYLMQARLPDSVVTQKAWLSWTWTWRSSKVRRGIIKSERIWRGAIGITLTDTKRKFESES